MSGDFDEQVKALQARLQRLVTMSAVVLERAETDGEIWAENGELASRMRALLDSGRSPDEDESRMIEELVATLEETVKRVAAMVTASGSLLSDRLLLPTDDVPDEILVATSLSDVAAQLLRQEVRVLESQIAGLRLAAELCLLRDAWIKWRGTDGA